MLVAWKCNKLMKMMFLGHKYYQENLLAIARLRGNTLKSLVFAKSDITSEVELWLEAENIRRVSIQKFWQMSFIFFLLYFLYKKSSI